MPDMTCPACGEASDVHHVRHDMTAPLPAFFYRDSTLRVGTDVVVKRAAESLPADMPDDLRTLTLAAINAEAAMENVLRSPRRPIEDFIWDPVEAAAREANEAWRAAMYRVGLRHGCDVCLLEPERRTHTERALVKAAFDSAWDGDPAELFG